jgi:hypothetical protein
MTIDASLYLGVELTGDDLTELARRWRRWRGARRVSIGADGRDGSLTVWRGEMPVMLTLIRPDGRAAFLLSEECLPTELAGPPPLRPHSILSLSVSTSPTSKADVGLRLAIELAADIARRWPCRLDNDGVGDGRRVYTEQEIIDADRQGEMLR